MNIKDKFLNHPIVNSVLILISVLFIISLIFIFFRSLTRVVRPPITVPIIPTVTPVGPTEPLDTSNPFNPTQALVFDWSRATVNVSPDIKEYVITSPLINPASVALMANKLGFTTTDSHPDSDDTGYIWKNDSASFFSSFTQNQIFYNTTALLPAHAKTFTKEEAVSTSKSIITDLLGQSLTGTLETQPEVRFTSFGASDADEEPQDTSPEASNLIIVNFKQTINNLPIISLSSKGEVISLALNTAGKVYRLNVYGGYLTTQETKVSQLYSFSDLQVIAPSQAMRISYSKDIEEERLFTNARNINIAVSKVSLGYFQRSDNALFPIFIIEGIMSTSRVTPYPAIFIVPAVKSQP